MSNKTKMLLLKGYLKSSHKPLYHVLVVQTPTQFENENSFSVIVNGQSQFSVSKHYEILILRISNGNFSFIGVENDKSVQHSFDFQNPFENLKKYIEAFNFTPIDNVFEYKEFDISNDEELENICQKFSFNNDLLDTTNIDVRYLENITYKSDCMFLKNIWENNVITKKVDLVVLLKNDFK